MSVKFFPSIMMGLSLAASTVYLAHGDWRRSLYWFAGAVITFSVTF